MKKLILIAVASFFLVQASNAQLFNIGVKGGVGFSKLTINDVSNISDWEDVTGLLTGDGVTGYHLGLQTRIQIAVLLIQPELYWNTGGGSLEQVLESGGTQLLEVKWNRIDIPLLVGAKLGPVRLNIGPVGSLVVSESNDGAAGDFELYKETMNWGWQGGIGVDLWKLSLDVRYEGSLSDLSDSLPEALQDFNMDPRPSQWIISAGFWFK